MTPDLPDPTGGWADGRSPYLWDKQLDGVRRLFRGVARPDLRQRPVRRMMRALVFVVLVFVVVPLVVVLVTAN